MYHNLEVPEQCLNLWQECQSLVPELLKNCEVTVSGTRIHAQSKFEPQPGKIYLVTEGDVFESFDGQLIVIHEKGDLLHADGIAYDKITSYDTDFPAIVDEYDGQAFLAAIAADENKFKLWNRYLSCLIQNYQLLVCHFSRQDTDYLPEFREYKKGDVIIEEGTEGDEVFTLLNGTASVMSNGEEVGEIHKDEIFGAIAALTNTKRNATIVATSDCDTLVATKENFRSILDTRPDIVQKTIADMARTIVSSNERIIELSKEKN